MKKYGTLSLILIVCLMAAITSACGSANTSSNGGSGKSKATKVVIIDPGGESDMIKPVLDKFQEKYPDLVSSIELIPASTDETTTKIKAEQASGNQTITLAINGYDGLSAGMEEGIWDQILPQYSDKLPGLVDSFTANAKMQYDMGNGYGIPHTVSQGGPMFTYNPDKVKNPPQTLDELLEYAKAHPGKVMYPRPVNSGAGFAWLQGIGYLLGEENPRDPSKWTKVWPYLEELGKYIDYYPAGSSVLYKEFDEGTRDIITTAVGYETNQRVSGAMPAKMTRLFMKNLTWVSDANFITIPKGLDEQRKDVSLKLIAFLMSPEMQAYTYDSGFMYPGPAVKGVDLSMAPQESQDKLKGVITQDLLDAMKKYPSVAPFDHKALITGFDMWDKKIGAQKK